MVSSSRELKNYQEDIAWHSFALGDVFAHLGSKRDGLSEAEVKRRLKHLGYNAVSKIKPPSRLGLFLRQLASPLVVVLALAGVVTAVIGSYADTAIIALVLVLNSWIGFVQERGAQKSLEGLKKLEAAQALVVREGQARLIDAREVVPGDIILLRPGDKVPADARLVKSYELRLDESLLTGESKEVAKNTGAVSVGSPIFERTNTVFGGTMVLDGTAEAVVFGTGEYAEAGRISRLVQGVPKSRTAFERKVARLGRFIGVVVVALSLGLTLWGLSLGREPKEMFLVAVAVAVAAVPESLPVALTVILVVGMKRVLGGRGLVRSLKAAETLGSTSVILTDKTGTLTYGRMQVVKVLTPERRGGLLELNATVETMSNHLLALSYAMLVSEVIIENPQDEFHDWVLRGSAVEKAVVMAGVQAGLDLEKLKGRHKEIAAVPFNSQRKFSVSFREFENNQIQALVLGAPDVLLAQVNQLQILNRQENITNSDLALIREIVDNSARTGLRLLAVCAKRIASRAALSDHLVKGRVKEVLAGLSLVGVIGLKDPVRDDVKEFLALSRGAGIRTVMVTGDHSLTARSVAREVGLVDHGRGSAFAGGRSARGAAEIMEGKEVESLAAVDLAGRVRGVDIFSRVSPQHKLKIVEAWQLQNEVVAVVGDGVNDAAALKRADVGVSLASGVELARESSDIILLEDSFSSLVKAIREGRVILDNIKKVIAYLLSTSFTELVLISLSLITGLPLAVTAAQILWVNLLHESLPAMALALDPAEKDVMVNQPASPARPLLDGFVRFLIAVVGVISGLMIFGVFYFFQTYFESESYARSVAFAALGTTALFYSLSIRSLREPIWEIPFFENRYLLVSIGLGLVLLAAAVYMPGLNALLKTQPLGALEWVVILAMGVLNIVLLEGAKWGFVHRKYRKLG
ncbi:MAG: HAD-IC family P-type ATPase [Patescibacteria group bacterium]